MELVTFQTETQPETTAQPVVAKKRKAGGGRKQMYTSKCVPFATSIPQEALPLLKEFTKSLKAQYKK